MKLISSDFADLCYNEIIVTSKEEISPELKVPKYRRLFESLFKELVKDDPQSFDGKYSLYGIMVYIIEKYNLPNEISEKVHNFRKFANIVIHNSNFNKLIPISPDDIEKFCIKSLCETILFFSEISVPDELLNLYRDLKEVPNLFSQKKQDRELKSTIVTFLSCSERKINIKGDIYYTLTCEAEDDGTQFLLNVFPPFEYIGDKFKKYTKAYLHNVLKSPNYDNLYNTAENSLIVIEPDYLIEARNLSECFHRVGDSHYFYFINKFINDRPSKEVISGTIVNNLLDKYILNGEVDFENSFNSSIDILQVIQLSDDDIIKIKEEIIKNHLNNIKTFSTYCRNNNPIIEPTFISPEYGLYGRLDIMLEGGKNQKDVIELKSGSVPNNGPWINHEMQVTAYNMLLDSTFTDRIGASSVFYSKATFEFLKNVVKDFLLYRNLINIRNKIVLTELSICDRDFSLFDELCNFDCSRYPQFIQTRFNNFKKIYKSLSELELEYFHNFIYFIFKELKAAKIGTDKIYEGTNNGFASLWLDTLEEKKDNSTILYNLRFRKYDTEKGTYIFDIDRNNPLTNFREGDICIIYSQDNKKPYKDSQIYKGTIISLDKNVVEIKLRNTQLSKNIFTPNNLWAIEHDLMEINFQNQIESLILFLDSNSEKKDKILCKRKPEFEAHDYQNNNYNENICLIVSKFKSAKDYFLLQGPPGTGKTSLALRVMIEETFNDNPKAKVAVIAYTNRAVDEISKSLSTSNNINIKNYVRIGSDYLEDERLLQKLVCGKSIDEMRTLLKNCNVFVSTISSFQKRFLDLLQPGEKFDVIFIDEASQIVETQIIGLLMYCKKFVLIGDHCQLPAVILQEEKEYKLQSDILKKIGLEYLSLSLFERLFIKCQREGWDYAIDTLKVHFRMHNDIVKLIKSNYSIELSHNDPRQVEEQKLFNSKAIDPIERLLSRSRTIFIPTKINKLESKYSTEEAKKIKAILETLLRIYNNNLETNNIGIITPWRIQINKIRSFIEEEDLLDKILIDTVERFQGSEKDIIIISVAVNNKHLLRNLQSENFDKSVDRKLNVALSRAKEHLILLGCEQIINSSHHYRNVINIIKESGGYITIEESNKYFEI